MDLNTINAENWMENEENYRKLLDDVEFVNKVPVLNANDLQSFKDESLVCFKGMIQDMHGPEYYLEKFETKHKSTNEIVMQNGKYRDPAISQGDCIDVDFDSSNNVTAERQTYVVISIPAVNSWAKNIEDLKYKIPAATEAPSGSKTKRSVEEMDVETTSSINIVTNVSDSPQKRQKSEAEPAKVNTPLMSKESMLNFPIPDPSGKACQIKLYSVADDLKLNDICEFYGFLSLDPSLSVQDDDNEDNAMEIQTHHPPASLIPRIHCVHYKKILHNNPLVSPNNRLTLERFQFIRKELSIVFTQLLLGDRLAAEYLIFHLISRVYHRKDFTALGKFSMNIYNLPKSLEVDFAMEIYGFIEMMVPKSYFLPMTLENMNDLAFTPKKDYDCNRLTSGVLQLSENTHLVLDETKLSNGKLNQAGIENVKSLAAIIKHQKIPYDFRYYQLEYESDIPVLVFSEGKSLLNTDCLIKLQPDSIHVNTFNEIIEAAKHFLKPDLLHDIRIYLTMARLADYEFTDVVESLVQDEFVKMRAADKNVNADDLHCLLVLARLVCIADGKAKLDVDSWNVACELERERKQRIQK